MPRQGALPGRQAAQAASLAKTGPLGSRARQRAAQRVGQGVKWAVR